MIEISARMGDLAVAEIVDLSVWRINRDAAASTATLDPTEHENAVAKIAKLARDHARYSLPGAEEFPEERFKALAPPVAATRDCSLHGGDPLDVWGRKLVIDIKSPRLMASITRLTISTFASDIAYPRSCARRSA
jgi:hypothetical protein